MSHRCNDSRSVWQKALLAGSVVTILMGLALLACTLSPAPTEPTVAGIYVSHSPTAVPGIYGHMRVLHAGKLLSILPPGGLGQEIRDLALDAQGRLWVATHIGLGMWSAGRWTTFNAGYSPLPHDDVRAVAVAPDGQTIWIGTADGLARFDGDAWVVYNPENSGLTSPVIEDLAFDRRGRLWIATSFGGVNVYDGIHDWSYYDKYNSGLLGFSVTAMTIGPDDRVWMVDGFGDGISMFDGLQWAHYTQENSGLSTNWIKQIAVDNSGRVWFVSYEGLNVLDGQTWNPYDFTPWYENLFSPRTLAQGPDGEAWVAGICPDRLAVYRFPALELAIGQVHEYSIPLILVPEGASLAPPLLFLDDQGTPISDAKEWAIPEPHVLLPTTDGAWLGTSYGLFRLYSDGRVETAELPNPQPPPRQPMRPTGNPIVEFLQIYEFHPRYIRVIAIGTVEVQQGYEPTPWLHCDQSSGPDLYNAYDVTEFIISENITICEGMNLDGLFRPINPPPVGERYTYWMSESVRRLPHLHTPNPIQPERAYHFGARAPQPGEGQQWLRVLAFPVSAEILLVHGSPPTAEVLVGDWRLFVYDVRETNRPHVNFILHDDMFAPSLESYLNAVGWQVGETTP